MEFGNAAQQTKHLPPILAGTVIWAQGYSEPGAGSDLASLSTRATLEGDRFVVRGHKIWTTWAHHSDWMFALVRTDPQAQPRQAGISFLLIDLHSPGIKIRPIRTIAGDDEFSEVFFDDVVCGREPGRQAARRLAHRQCTARSRTARHLQPAVRTDGARPHPDDGSCDRHHRRPAFQDRLAAATINVTALSAMFNHAVELTNNERSLGPESSVIKIFGSELLQALNDLLMEAAGGLAPADRPIATDFGEVDVATSFLFSRRVTIYGGSSEIQRNVLARRVLNLPN